MLALLPGFQPIAALIAAVGASIALLPGFQPIAAIIAAIAA